MDFRSCTTTSSVFSVLYNASASFVEWTAFALCSHGVQAHSSTVYLSTCIGVKPTFLWVLSHTLLPSNKTWEGSIYLSHTVSSHSVCFSEVLNPASWDLEKAKWRSGGWSLTVILTVSATGLFLQLPGFHFRPFYSEQQYFLHVSAGSNRWYPLS